MTMQTERTHYSIREAAHVIGVHYNTVYRWLHDGTLRGVQVGPRLWRIPRNEVKRMLELEDTEAQA